MALSPFMKYATAFNMNCWTLKPESAAAVRIAVPVSLSGRIVIESRLAFHLAAARFCASDGDTLSPPLYESIPKAKI